MKNEKCLFIQFETEYYCNAYNGGFRGASSRVNYTLSNKKVHFVNFFRNLSIQIKNDL